ncbi:MAG: DUF167 domain-containing protein [Nitrospinales bacterium]
MSLQIKKCKNGVQFSAYILPRSSQNTISGLHDKALKIKLTSPPVDGEANKMLIKFLAKTLKTTPANIFIVSGATGRNKSISVENFDEEQLMAKLYPFITKEK